MILADDHLFYFQICPDCEGDGGFMVSGFEGIESCEEAWEDCGICDGRGYIPEICNSCGEDLRAFVDIPPRCEECVEEFGES